MPKISTYIDGGELQAADQFVIARAGANKSILAGALGGGWTPVTGSWAYASASTITIPSDGTLTYQKGMKIRFKQGGGYKYAAVNAITSTLITIVVNTNYTVANSAITDIAYSYTESPFGWPDWFDWAPTPTASGSMTLSGITFDFCKYHISGKMVTISGQFKATLGGTASNRIYIPLPINAANAASAGNPMYANVYDSTAMGAMSWIISTNNILVAKYNDANFNLGASKYVTFGGSYPMA